MKALRCPSSKNRVYRVKYVPFLALFLKFGKRIAFKHKRSLPIWSGHSNKVVSFKVSIFHEK